MTTSTINPGVTSAVTSAPSTATAATTSATSSTGSTGTTALGLANNFQTFLTLLTTQLKNQNPLDPLDTNQFTQQLVEFAGVEQQMKQNDQLSTLVSLDQNAQSTTALNFVGATVAVVGQGAALPAKGDATWSLNAQKPATGAITISAPNGQTAYSGTMTLNAGAQNFTWNGLGDGGVQWPPGNYTMSIVGTDASGQPVTVTTQVQGVVDSVDLTQTPPVLSVGGQNYTVNQIQRVVRPGA
jgi:flagellar basal-body rod modification protein FlgD